MGANEKHDATYHGGEYTPDTEIMRFLFKIGRLTRNKNVGGEQMDDEFDRWLETVRAEAKAEAWAEGHAAGEGSVKAKDNPYKENQ